MILKYCMKPPIVPYKYFVISNVLNQVYLEAQDPYFVVLYIHSVSEGALNKLLYFPFTMNLTDQPIYVP